MADTGVGDVAQQGKNCRQGLDVPTGAPANSLKGGLQKTRAGSRLARLGRLAAQFIPNLVNYITQMLQ